MSTLYSFGEWIKRRRISLRYTQRVIGEKAFCSTAMIKKIEADERQPSYELAQHLALALEVSQREIETFIACARGERPVDQLSSPDTATTVTSLPPTINRLPPLPQTVTPFIGRTREMQEIADRLRTPSCRLMTLLGTGGIGKTRLAIATAEMMLDEFEDGVLFVSLAATHDAGYLPDTIIQAFGIPPADEADRQLINYMRRRSMLLILDNCEQLGDGIEWLSVLLTAAPTVKILVTSRAHLQLTEEWLYPVPVLAEAQELFNRSATRTQPSFDAEAEQKVVEEICQLVDGLPLAVELASGWTAMMSCGQIAAHIRRDIDFLATNARNIPERHRSMRAIFEQSWSQLHNDAQRTLRRLSVFRGGFTAETAQAVAGASLTTLRNLHEKSLVRISPLSESSEYRYDLHELVRQYAAARLWEVGEEDATRQGHADAFVAMAAQSQERYFGSTSSILWRTFDQERDNFRVALDWLLSTRQSESMLKLTNDLWFYWFWRGYRNEAVRWLAAAIDLAGDQDSWLQCMALNKIAPPLALQGRFKEAYHYAMRNRPMAERLGDPFLIANAKIGDAMVSDDLAEVEALFRAALSMLDDLPETHEVGSRLAAGYLLFGDILRQHGRYDEAKALYEQSLALCHRFDNRDWIVAPLGNLGRLALQEGNLSAAHKQFSECVTLARAGGHQLSLADWLVRLGESQLYLGNYAAAKANLREMLQICDEMGHRTAEADAHGILCHLLVDLGDMDGAQNELSHCMAINRVEYQRLERMGSFARFFRPELADSFTRLGLMLQAVSDNHNAMVAFGVASSLGKQIDHVPDPPLHQIAERSKALAESHLTTHEHTAAFQEGRSMSMDEILTFTQQVC